MVGAFVVAALAMAGSLYFSEIAHFEPCRLCWYQRIAMYPLVVILGIAAWRRDIGVRRYAVPLAAIGAVISTYHYALEWFPWLDSGVCVATMPCTLVWFRELGFISLPYLALSAFLLIIALLWLARVPEDIETADPQSFTRRSDLMAKRSRRRQPPPSPSRRPPPRPASRSTRPAGLVLAIGGLVIAGAAIAAIALTQLGSSAAASPSGSPSPLATSAPVAGVPLPPFVEGVDDQAVGQPMLEFDGTDFAGTPVSIRADGRPKVLLFLAHWCPHCQREVPVVQDWVDANGMPVGVDFISVATANDPNLPNYPPDAWLAREGWEVPVLVDGGRRIANDYGLTAFPYWVAIDADGKVASRRTGELTPAQLDALVASVAAS